MSIGSFVEKSLDCYRNGYFDVALALACSCVDATAAKTDSSKVNNVRYKAFLKNNMRIITEYGFPGISANGIRIGCRNIPDLKTDDKEMIGIEDIIYHTIRCGLLHQCEIDKHLEFTDRTFIGDIDGIFKIPSAVIMGLLVSVILNESNESEMIIKSFSIKINGKILGVNQLWGKKNDFY